MPSTISSSRYEVGYHLIVTGYAYTHERKPRCRAIAFRRKTTFVTNKEVMRAIKIKRSDGNS
ncbi:MAG: hypothetical protein HWQ23_05870 [Nostoc sp. JL33]|uniref:hypothetical protein n=1 Tax=Nostoc sp. JL33 TaxID=2815396 RepID=UPI0025D8D552|nr:hypothetical protein [Nostoc sp. JL33]MBN3869834.1 hypothetical protein [Nostoc sp. JL33]